MNFRFLVPLTVSLLVPACTAEVLGEPDAVDEAPAASNNESLAGSVGPFYSFFLPASKEALCVFGDGTTFRGAATTSDAAYVTCASRAVASAGGALRIAIAQDRSANGTCTTALYVDGRPRNARTSACNSSFTARVSGGVAQNFGFGPGNGQSLWYIDCVIAAAYSAGHDYTNTSSYSISCGLAVLDRLGW